MPVPTKTAAMHLENDQWVGLIYTMPIYQCHNAVQLNARAEHSDIELAVIKDLVDAAVVEGLLGGENLVAVGINTNLLSSTAGVLSQCIFHQATHALNLCCLNLQVGNLALSALGCWLVNQDARVRKRCALAGST